MEIDFVVSSVVDCILQHSPGRLLLQLQTQLIMAGVAK